MRKVLLFLAAGIISSGARAAATYQCLSCPPGSYSDSGTTGCKPCPANHYCPGATTKLACPAWATAAAGAANKNDCKALPIGIGLGGQYCAATNKNECTANAAWAGGSNTCYSTSSTYTAWDGTSWSANGGVSIGTIAYKAQQNGYGIQASTWACKDSKKKPLANPRF